jgi:ribonucleoside-diphosphate reductase alpha chain
MSKALALMGGEPKVLEGYGVRHSTRMAVAPTTSSSFILGQVSPSIEPLQSNYFTKDLAKGKFTYKNPYLMNLLASKGKDDSDTWKSIMMKGGSVQHLDFLNEEEKDVFKTFAEISQMEVVQQAADRQEYIDQGQSLNVMIADEVPLKDVNQLVIKAWELGIKTLYYQRGVNKAQAVGRDILNCAVCEA